MERALRRTFLLAAGLAVAVMTNAQGATAGEGDLDPTFDGDGIATLFFGPTDDRARAVAIQPDGNIVVVGQAAMAGGDQIAVARYDPAGNLDASFSGDGKDLQSIGFGDSRAWDVALQPDGKIVVVGCAVTDVDFQIALLRYRPDGSLDTSFDGDGIRFDGPAGSCAQGVALQPDGKIVVTGYSGSRTTIAVARYNSNGSDDNSFSGDGIDLQDTGFGSEEAWDVAVQPDGRVVAVGCSVVDTTQRPVLLRYLANGTLDTSFDTNGILIDNYSGLDDCLHAVALQDDGEIVVAGTSGNRANTVVARYDSTDGSRDTSFSGDGFDTRNFGLGADELWDVAIQADDKIVAAGFSVVDVDTSHLALRYQPNGSLDTGFSSPDGWVTHRILDAPSSGQGMALQADGKIVVAGFADLFGGPLFATVRYDVPSIVFADGFESGDTSVWSETR